jgi:hypothetical protein
MSRLARRRTAKPAPKNTDLGIFLRVFGVRQGVVERAVRRSMLLQRRGAKRAPARAFEPRAT